MLWILLGVVILALLAVVVLYFYPKKVAQLQATGASDYSYEQSVAAIEQTLAEDKRHADVKEDCLPVARLHDKPTAKAVVMLHGISACPEQFGELADTFYKAGYNVYVPRVPQHGFSDNAQHAELSLNEMGDFLQHTADVASGLGEEVGVVGLSGGGNMASWLVQRSSVFSRALLLSPFYEPALRHVPKWQIPFMMSLYGRNILPNYFNGELAVRTVAKYVLLYNNYHPDLHAPALEHVAVVTSDLDDDIDLALAHHVPQQLAKINNTTYKETRLSDEFAVYHDIVGPNTPGMSEHKAQLYQMYLEMYENTAEFEQ